MLSSRCSVSGRGVSLVSARGATGCLPASRCKQLSHPTQTHRQTSAGIRTWALADIGTEAADLELDREPCYPAFVYMDNKSTESYTEFTVEVKDYPGLLRVISWVLNGQGVRVNNAVMKTLEDGTAQDVFWVTDLKGRKLSDRSAEDVEDRLAQFVSYCAPPTDDTEFREYKCGNIHISNTAHESFTIATITAELFSPGLLFELASVINGQGISVAQAIIRGGDENPITPEHLQELGGVPEPPPGKRVIQMWLKETHSGSKLEYLDVSALIYTLRLVMGNGNLSTTPPNADINIIACPCDEDTLGLPTVSTSKV